MLGEQAQRVAQDHFSLKEALVIDDLGDALGDYEISLPTRKRGGSVFMGMEMGEILTLVETALQRVERLAPFLPEDMLAHLVNTDRHRRLVSEFRPVAVQFIHIVGLEALAVRQGPEVATAIFQRCFVRAEEIISQHEGVISQVDAYTEGFFLLNTFGTPKAHEGTTRYAVSAALQLAKVLEQINQEFKLETPLQQRGGITYGLVFNGEVGAKYRRESVVVGPAVNRAARLMSKAQFGQVILDAEIWEDTRTAFVGEQLPPVKLKGIDGQVVIVNVHEIRRGARLQPLERPLLGREAEQRRLAEAQERLLRQRQGDALLIYGETGLGKTSLISDLAQKARPFSLTILAGRCQPHGKNIPLFVWTDLLIGWLDIDESADPAKERARLAAELASLEMLDAEKALGDLLALGNNGGREAHQRVSLAQPPKGASLLGALNQRIREEKVVSAVSQPGGLTALLGSRLNQAQTSSVTTLWKRLEDRTTGPAIIIRLLQQLSQKRPLLMILEDIHWMDHESALLLDKLTVQAAGFPILLILTGRKPKARSKIEMVKLTGLSDSALTQVAQRALGAHTLDGSLAEWICQQAHGNPLYAEELCQALRQADAIFLDRDTGEVRWTKQAPALPLSLHELMLARLDELPLVQQDVLKRAAVIGVSFDDESLLHLSKDRIEAGELRLALEQVVQAGFVVEIQDKRYHFSHPLMQEAIYATLSYSQRQLWHTEIGRWLSQQQPEPPIELLAYHYLRGNEVEKAAKFALRAGQRAHLQGAYTGALDYYEQVGELQSAANIIKMAAAEYQGDILMILKDYSTARGAYRQAIQLGSLSAVDKLAILSGDLEALAQTQFTPSLRPWAEASKAWLLAQNDQIDQALRSIQTAMSLDASQEAIKTLHTALKNREPLGPYEEWLQQFAQATMTAFRSHL
jgi:class 3 adenylate cyclase